MLSMIQALVLAACLEPCKSIDHIGTIEPPPTIQGWATYYHPSLAGNRMGCMNAGWYNPSDPSVAAVGRGFVLGYACGQPITIVGPAGVLTVTQTDTCGGCGPTHIDLSEAGIVAVCGGKHSCSIQLGRTN